MSVVLVREVPVNREGIEVVEFPGNGIVDFEVRFHRQFIVQTNDPADGAVTVLSNANLPRALSTFNSGNDAFGSAVCIRRTCKQRGEGQRIFDVRCDYSTNVGDFDDDDPVNDFINQQSVRWSLESRPRIILRDQNGKKIRNAADDPFDPPPEIEEPIVVANITRRELPTNFDVATLVDYAGAINSDAFDIDDQSIDPRFAMFAGYDSVDVIKEGQRTKEVTYVIKILAYNDAVDNPDNHDDFSLWDGEFLEHGPNYRKTATDKTKVRAATAGFPYNVNLDKTNGTKLDDDAAPQFSFFPIRKRKSFGALNFK